MPNEAEIRGLKELYDLFNGEDILKEIDDCKKGAGNETEMNQYQLRAGLEGILEFNPFDMKSYKIMETLTPEQKLAARNLIVAYLAQVVSSN